MPFETDWYDKAQSIILVRFVGNWTDKERSESAEIVNQLSQQATGRFDIISDFSDTALPPVGTLWIWQEGATVRDIDFPNWGLTVIVTSNSVIEAFFEEGIQSSDAIRKHCRLVKTMQDAINTIFAARENH